MGSLLESSRVSLFELGLVENLRCAVGILMISVILSKIYVLSFGRPNCYFWLSDVFGITVLKLLCSILSGPQLKRRKLDVFQVNVWGLF